MLHIYCSGLFGVANKLNLVKQNKMNIEELKKKKAKLQCNIQKLLSDFEKETGTRISDVNYFIEDRCGFVVSKGFEIRVEI